MFEEGQSQLQFDVTILPDATPEQDEVFTVSLSQPSGGAVLGTDSTLTVTILSNDNANGRIGFADSALFVSKKELSSDQVVDLKVVREQGTFGRVVVAWNITGNVSSADVSPMSGNIVFQDGDSESKIPLTIHKDSVPELNEVAFVR